MLRCIANTSKLKPELNRLGDFDVGSSIKLPKSLAKTQREVNLRALTGVWYEAAQAVATRSLLQSGFEPTRSQLVGDSWPETSVGLFVGNWYLRVLH